jgi:hypothetical protein
MIRLQILGYRYEELGFMLVAMRQR